MLTINGQPKMDSGLSVHNVKPEKKAPAPAKPKAKAPEPVKKTAEEPKDMKKNIRPKPAETAALDPSRRKDRPKRRPVPGAETRRSSGRRR